MKKPTAAGAPDLFKRENNMTIGNRLISGGKKSKAIISVKMRKIKFCNSNIIRIEEIRTDRKILHDLVKPVIITDDGDDRKRDNKHIRNIIEHHVLLLMDESGNISDTQKELFNEQYKLIEYKSYKDNKLILTGTVIDPEQMEENYLSAKSVFIKHGFSESNIKAFLRTRVPFLCDKDFNFNSAIKKYCPDFEDAYIYLSRRIHPSTYYEPVNTKYVQNIIMVIVFMLTDKYTKLYHL